jgi:methyl-accepting chemotaxis protein
MIEKLNKVFEKLPPEHRDTMREAFIILIEEVINAVVKDNERIWQAIEKMNERFERQEKENERVWQNIERIWQAIEQNTKAIEELRKTIKEGFERQEKENQRIWQAIEEMRKTMKEVEEGYLVLITRRVSLEVLKDISLLLV